MPASLCDASASPTRRHACAQDTSSSLRCLVLRPRLRAQPPHGGAVRRVLLARPLRFGPVGSMNGVRSLRGRQVAGRRTLCFRSREGVRAESARRPGKRVRQHSPSCGAGPTGSFVGSGVRTKCEHCPALTPQHPRNGLVKRNLALYDTPRYDRGRFVNRGSRVRVPSLAWAEFSDPSTLSVGGLRDVPTGAAHLASIFRAR